MRAQLVLNLEGGDDASCYLMEHVFGLIGGNAMSEEDQKPFGRVKGNAFTMDDLREILEIVVRRTSEPVEIVFEDSARQRIWEDGIRMNRRVARTKLRSFLERLKEDLEKVELPRGALYSIESLLMEDDGEVYEGRAALATFVDKL